MDSASAAYADAVSKAWAESSREVRSFWQSQVVTASINRLITGDPDLSPPAYFKRRFSRKPFKSALSLGSGEGQMERQFVSLDICHRILGVDVSQARVARARANVPIQFADRVEYICANLEEWRPDRQVDLIIAKGVLHHVQALEDWCRLFAEMLMPEGLLYLDDFVGPTRFQWTTTQLDIINRVLAVLPDDVKIDLVAADGRRKERVSPPDVDRLIAADPSEAVRSAEIPEVIKRYMVPIELKPYGGALYHPLFSRIMGNFAQHPDLVELIMELDAILTEQGVIGSDYLWGVYRPR